MRAPVYDFSEPSRLELLGDAWVDYDPHFLAEDAASFLMAELIAECDWEARTLHVMGKKVTQPRLMAWAGSVPYHYSGQTLFPLEPGPVLQSLWRQIEAREAMTFNHVVINYYRDGSDNVGMHADDEPELGENPKIVAVSLGAKRRFVLERKRKPRGEPRTSLWLGHGSYMVMGGTLQHTWRHALPKVKGECGPRLNITFRKLLRSPPERILQRSRERQGED